MTLRIGILGAARVATYALIAPAREVDGVMVAGIAARDSERAKAYAKTHAIALVFPTYDALIASREIDVVYNALPPNLHARWSIAALAAGKPVLCEKPFALSVVDVDAMLAAEARSGLLLMEAQHSHYHPLSARMREVVRNGILGPIRRIEAVFDVPVSKGDSEIRYLPDIGGGALWDLGVYPAYWIRSTMSEEPIILDAHQMLAPSGADIVTKASLALPSGATATLTCNMDAPFRASFTAIGRDATLRVTNPLSPQSGHTFCISANDGAQKFETFPLRSSYAYQLEAFRDAVVHGAPVPTHGADSLATIRMLAAIRAKAKKD